MRFIKQFEGELLNNSWEKFMNICICDIDISICDIDEIPGAILERIPKEFHE